MPAILSRVLALSVALLPAPAAGRLTLAPRAHGTAELDVHKVPSHVSLRQDSEGGSVDKLGEDADTSGHRLAGLAEVERDLESTETEEDSEIKQLDEQIASLLQKRNALKVEKARRAHDVAFVKAEASRLRRRAGSASIASASSASNATAGAEASAESGAEAAAAAAEAEAEAEASRAAAAQQAQQQQQQQQQQQEAAHAAEVVAAEEKKRAEEAAAAKQREIAEARAKAKREAQEEEHRRRMQEDAEYRAQEEKRQQMDEAADSADDSFKQFMKEEDGEDEQGDADYEDSANALAGAIGWNRHEIESKADNAVKQLTEAIGGKKVVQSLQGMMAGVR